MLLAQEAAEKSERISALERSLLLERDERAGLVPKQQLDAELTAVQVCSPLCAFLACLLCLMDGGVLLDWKRQKPSNGDVEKETSQVMVN